MDSEFDSIECVAEARWRKLIFNCAWNSTTALTGLNTHQLLQRTGASQMVLQLAQEAYAVAIASGVELDLQMPYETVKAAATSAPITPSTLQDARNKRPMELTPIFGYLVMQAAKVGVQVPCITLMYDLLRQMNDAFVTRQTWQVPDMLLPAVEQLLGREQIRER
ncbi:hypothetical protein PRZ48_013116 [Zasmidium cellare]|uniref:Ketopantoate reductase C-terminal domain-containing protein n=1 Tax=Zasmidium cellare TaxID=395010 RepID=A0ABR0E3M2_ZASCE|nr:hypothetical protein PRZ48_013116 [Zasmidium cellare]